MIAQPAPEPAPEMDVAEETLEPTPPEEPVVEEALAEDVPPAPLIEPAAPTSESVQAETVPAPTTVTEQTPETVAEPVAEPVKEVAVVEPEPAPALPSASSPAPDTAPVSAVTQEPMTEPVAPPAAVEAMTPAEQTPPPPQALSQSEANAQAGVDEAQEAMPQDAVNAPASPSSVVVDLPPKLEEMQPGVASLPPSTGPLSDGDNMRIVFENDSSKLPSDAREALKTLSARMNQQDGLRLQLLAYAGGTDTSASAARRLSLSRALAVRSYLIENGVRSTRIDVRALGNKSTEAVTERVDITIVER
jgi:outer membrane protein OmpA-like peptidoglycan-associated protein